MAAENSRVLVLDGHPDGTSLCSALAAAAAGSARARGAGRGGAPGGTFGLRVRTVSEVSRSIRDRVRSDDGLRDLMDPKLARRR